MTNIRVVNILALDIDVINKIHYCMVSNYVIVICFFVLDKVIL